MKKKLWRSFCLLICMVMLFSAAAYAHPGRTDASGGHHDYKNVSGLGSYHYHCGGYPAHLHPGGVCPYKSGSQTASGSSGSGAGSKSALLKLNKESVTLEKGDTVKLKVKNNSAGSKISWSSNKKKVASVTAKGVVKAKKKGTAVITAKVAGKTLKCKVKVTG